ncbi:MAG: hypothetical protein JO141_20230 [Bradyrhizobium sp.]|nr:hypothetical protein [Bradyrhizobium sp.]
MAEEVQLLRLVRAFTKLRDPQRRREIVDLAEASVEAETRPRPWPEEKAADLAGRRNRLDMLLKPNRMKPRIPPAV